MPSSTLLHIVANPAAGGGRVRRALPKLLARLESAGVPFRSSLTQRGGHGADLAGDAARSGALAVLAVGGDGTVHDVANGLLDAAAAGATPPPLGVLPVGTGNDFVKLVAGTGDPVVLYQAVLDGRVRRFDAGRVTWRGGQEHFVNAMGLGIDVEVVRQLDRLPRLPGVVAYFGALLAALVKYRAIAVRLRVDGQEVRDRVMMAAVSNGTCLGGGFRLTPDARPDDGRFDVCVIRKLGPVGIARTLPRTLRGTHAQVRDVTMLTGGEVEIEVAEGEPLYFQLDGELREPADARSLRIEVLPGVLPVIDPGAEPGA